MPVEETRISGYHRPSRLNRFAEWCLLGSTLDYYYRLPVFAQELALTAYGARLSWLRQGKGQSTLLDSLVHHSDLPFEEVRGAQHRKLAEVLTSAARDVPYYRDLSLSLPHRVEEAHQCLKSWPILDKATIQKNSDRLLSTRHRASVEIHTGGTTGRPLAIHCDRAALNRNYAHFSLLERWAGKSGKDWVATFAGRPLVPYSETQPPFWRRNFASRQLLFSSYHISPDTVEAYTRALERAAPALIDSYPSSLEAIARHILRGRPLEWQPKAIITSSETLFPEVRKIIEEAFSCPVFDHYGAAEMVAFIPQCEEGTYHPMPTFGYLEILGPDDREVAIGETGELIATGFINPVMPLVRYRTGDLAERREGSACPCGRNYPMIGPPQGRADDVIVTPEGRRIGRIDPIFKAVDSIHEAQIVQTHSDRIRIDIVSGDGFDDLQKSDLTEELRLRLGHSMRIEFAEVNGIERTASGKLRMVISEVPKRGAADHE